MGARGWRCEPHTTGCRRPEEQMALRRGVVQPFNGLPPASVAPTHARSCSGLSAAVLAQASPSQAPAHKLACRICPPALYVPRGNSIRTRGDARPCLVNSAPQCSRCQALPDKHARLGVSPKSVSSNSLVCLRHEELQATASRRIQRPCA